jgi:3'(2'), 5'-bisphosphate nucleotidase
MIDKLISIVRKADKEILGVYDTADAEIEYKADDSPLTEADRRSNKTITDGLREYFPDIPVISEENKAPGFEERREWKRSFLVDPLDGTKEFIKRNGEFTVNIALIENGVAVAGVMSIPVKGLIYHGVKGQGAFRVEGEGGPPEPIECDSATPGTNRLVAAVSRSHLSEKTEGMIKALGADTVSAGSALKFVMVVEGKADLYPRLGPTCEWDTAAGEAIAGAAGAVVCGLDGWPLGYNKESLRHEGFLVCRPGLKDRILTEVHKVL